MLVARHDEPPGPHPTEHRRQGRDQEAPALRDHPPLGKVKAAYA